MDSDRDKWNLPNIADPSVNYRASAMVWVCLTSGPHNLYCLCHAMDLNVICLAGMNGAQTISEFYYSTHTKIVTHENSIPFRIKPSPISQRTEEAHQRL